jgi:hypothetical protein
MGHCIPAKPVKEERVWQFDGNFDCPTFSPSVRHFLTDPETKQEKTTCHYIIEKGMIKYQGDCEHKLSGQTIPMQNIPEDYGFN